MKVFPRVVCALSLVVGATGTASAAGGSTGSPAAQPTKLLAATDVSVSLGSKMANGGSFILRARPGDLDALIADVNRSGAKVNRRLAIINAVAATVPASGSAALAKSAALVSVTTDAPVRPQGKEKSTTTTRTTSSATSTSTTTTADPVASTSTTSTSTVTDGISEYASDSGSMRWITQNIGATTLWSRGATGAGIDIAVVDTGVAQVPGLAGKVIDGPDISLDSPYAPVLGVDAYGHGTHMASIAAGLDAGTTNLTDPTKFVGVAPGARIINVKVGAFDGATDVSQVIAGIDWVVQHRKDPGFNIRVLNLSYGTDSLLPTHDDPLSWAAEVAWRYGIVVVASAGNDGSQTKVLSPANNPVIIAVGALNQDTKGRLSAADFTSTSGTRQPDVWAPGNHVLGLRVPNSYVDARYPTARVGTRLFRGSGTSQAAAVTSGAAALLLSANPTANPDQIKAALMRGKGVRQEAGSDLDLDTADMLLKDGSLSKVNVGPYQGFPGEGSLEATRGNGPRLSFNGVLLTGEQDIFGKTWNGPLMAYNAAALRAWNGGVFNGSQWSGNAWAGNAWAGSAWTGNAWAGNAWAGNAWAGNAWAGSAWTGNAWAGNAWAGNAWAGNSWSGNAWAGNAWAGGGWQGNVWG